MVMPDGFPGDLLEEILCRVPATSLQRIRYSCRLWNNICDSRRFTRKHFRKSPKQCLILMMNEFRVSSMSLNLFKNPSVEATRALSLADPCFSSEQFEISKVSHCEGLLLCTNVYQTRIVVWNPCTGETRWIQTRDTGGTYALGFYHDKNSHGKSYKILSYNMGKFYPRPEFAIYEFNSNSWRTIDTTLECHVEHSEFCVSLKGNTYWVVSAVEQKQLGVFLLAFDYTTETFRQLCLPYQCPSFEVVSLSVVREEKLSVLLQRDAGSMTEIWLTNRIGETKVVSWSMILHKPPGVPPDFNFFTGVTFLVDEEKKVVVCCDKYMVTDLHGKNLVHIIGWGHLVQIDFGFVECWPFLFHYVPSLAQV